MICSMFMLTISRGGADMDQKKIGKYIADKRKDKGITQAALAEELCVSDKAVSKWERGICLPDVSKYQELCGILNISLNELFAGEDLDTANVVRQSEKNLIGIARFGKMKSSKLLKIIIGLIVCVAVLVVGLILVMNNDDQLKGNYITAFSVENPDEANMLRLFGDATLFNYSLDENYENVDIEIIKYVNGTKVGEFGRELNLPYGRRQNEAIAIEPDLEKGTFNFTLSTENGGIGKSIFVEVAEDEKLMGYTEVEAELPVNVEKGKKIPVYLYMADDGDLMAYPLKDVKRNPSKTLSETDLCFFITFVFD